MATTSLDLTGVNSALAGMQNLDYGQFTQPLTELAKGIISQLFAPGGQVDTATNAALRNTVKTGFGTSSGSFTNAKMNILKGAENQVASSVSQGAISLAPLALSRAEDIFSGNATIEQMKMAEQQLKDNERLMNAQIQHMGCTTGSRISGGLSGALGGAAAASVIPGIGPLAGGIIGGLSGLFGGGGRC